MHRPSDSAPDPFGAVASKLLAGTGDAPNVAGCVLRAVDELTRHLTPLIGEIGVRALLSRSAARSAARYPWLAGAIPIIKPADAPWASLRTAFNNQDRRTAIEGFGALLSAFVELFQRLIGKVLVAQLMHEVWPDVFPQPDKETT